MGRVGHRTAALPPRDAGRACAGPGSPAGGARSRPSPRPSAVRSQRAAPRAAAWARGLGSGSTAHTVFGSTRCQIAYTQGCPHHSGPAPACRLRPWVPTFPAGAARVVAPPLRSAPSCRPRPAPQPRPLGSAPPPSVPPAPRGAGTWRSWTSGSTARWSTAGSEVMAESAPLGPHGRWAGEGRPGRVRRAASCAGASRGGTPWSLAGNRPPPGAPGGHRAFERAGREVAPGEPELPSGPPPPGLLSGPRLTALRRRRAGAFQLVSPAPPGTGSGPPRARSRRASARSPAPGAAPDGAPSAGARRALVCPGTSWGFSRGGFGRLSDWSAHFR